MHIREIHINSFRHLEDVHLGSFTQPSTHSDIVALAGPNGGGKSSVLELLGSALSSTWSLSWSIHRSFPTNSFEVAIALTTVERGLVMQYLESENTSSGYASDVVHYLQEHGVYYRSFNYSEGQYQKDSSLYNQIHNLVTTALRNHYNRSIGFFLRSDRYYPSKGFQQQRIFQYSQMVQQDHIWNMAFNTSDLQYNDMFDFLVQQRYHYFHNLGAYHHRRLNARDESGTAVPSDPLKPYDDLLQKLFPGYKFSDNEENVPTNLFVELPSGDIVPFSDLSSGEKEVFFILSFFLRHDVNNAIIVIDEPELHLHPEFARLLIRTMQSIKPGNQIWVGTHNTEIIDEAGRDRVFYLARDIKTQKSVVTPGTDETEAIRQLKNFFGFSGYIGIAKNIVFLEGLNSSSDRKLFSSLFPEYGNKLKFVPSKSSENLPRINTAVLSILESNLGWIEFYLIRDRDYLTPETIRKFAEHSSGRMYVLNRYHIENYLLDEELIADVQKGVFGKQTTSDNVRARLESIVRKLSGEVLRDMVSFRLNLIYRPEDFSLGNFMRDQALIHEDGNWIEDEVENFKKYFVDKTISIHNHLSDKTTTDALDELISQCQEEIRHAVSDNDSYWKKLFPGRRLLEEYGREEGLGKPPVLQNSLIKELSSTPDKIPSELRKVIDIIASGGLFIEKN